MTVCGPQTKVGQHCELDQDQMAGMQNWAGCDWAGLVWHRRGERILAKAGDCLWAAVGDRPGCMRAANADIIFCLRPNTSLAGRAGPGPATLSFIGAP